MAFKLFAFEIFKSKYLVSRSLHLLCRHHASVRLVKISTLSLRRRPTWWCPNEPRPPCPAQVGSRLREGMSDRVEASTLLTTLLPHPFPGKEPPVSQEQEHNSQISEKGRCLRGKPCQPARQLDRPDQPGVPGGEEPVEHVHHRGGGQLLHGQEEQGWGLGCLCCGK